jgi:hypothetical protein
VRARESRGVPHDASARRTWWADSNSGARLNQTKFDDIVDWTDADAFPVDRADLIDDGQLRSSFSSSTAIRGVTNLSVWSDVRNIGTQTSGTMQVAYCRADLASPSRIVNSGGPIRGRSRPGTREDGRSPPAW